MPRPPSPARLSRAAGLLWPGLLVVPPIVILSIVALYLLREARATAESEARRNAAPLARDLARTVGSRAGTELAALVVSGCSAAGLEARGTTDADSIPSPLCGVIVDGRPLVPRDYDAVPSPPAWLLGMAEPQARQWRQLADAPARADPPSLGRIAAALASGPTPLRLNAEWAVLRAEASGNPSAATITRLADLARRAAGVPSESGTPLSDLALLAALRHVSPGAVPDALLQALRQQVVEAPSLLTGALVEEAARVAPRADAVRALQVRWMRSERALALLRRVPQDVDGVAAVHVEDADGAWLALVHPLVAAGARVPRTALHVTLVPASLVERALRAALSGRDDLPAYASVSVGLGGRVWYAKGPPQRPSRPVELAAASGQIDLPLVLPSDAVATSAGELWRAAPDALAVTREAASGLARLSGVPGAHAFTLGLELGDPDRLYSAYRTWVAMVAALVLAAALAAFGGLAATWRAFGRQRRLAAMKSDFVANVSHELRAPIAAVRLMSESLERGTVDDEDRRREYVRLIGRECRRLSSLVENVLDFSRIDRGRREYSFEPADLAALVAQTADVMRPSAAERGVNLVTLPAPSGIGAASVDRTALEQALVNLVDNAIKHSPEHADVKVGVELDRGAGGDNAGTARLVVEDRGPGIPPEDHERIFEPFYRRGSELRRETRGIGIGLSIVKHVAEAHGGRVTVCGNPGGGSRFAIEIPLVEGPR